MTRDSNPVKTKKDLLEENRELRIKLEEAEETLNAIKSGEIDSIVVDVPEGSQIYSLDGADYLYRVLVQEMSEGVTTLTSDGTIFYSNAQFANLIQQPLDKVIGQNINDFISPEDKELFQYILKIGLKGEKKGELNLKSTDGTIIPISISIKTIEDLNGSYALITDLREQKYYEMLQETQEALKKSEELLRTVVENSHDGISLIDLKSGFYTFMSPAQEELTGFTMEEINSFTTEEAYERIHPNDREKLSSLQKRMSASLNSEAMVEYQWKIKSGEYCWFHDSRKLVIDDQGKPIGLVSVSRDITAQKQAEELKQFMLEKEQQLTEELSASNEELQATAEELKTTNEELIHAQNSMQELINKLKTSNKELEQFAYVASHDLQEPLRTVASFTQLLEMRYKDKLDEDADDYIGFIVEGAKRMKDLIDDLLAFSRLNTESKEFELIMMEITLDDVLTNLKPSIKKNKAEVTYDPLPSVMADSSQINQLLQNLIANAIKFHGDKPPKIDISAREVDDEWIITVSDEGIGISPEHHEQIFNIFTRLHTREKYEGTGIGLSICKRIVERHGGRIWVESEPDKGSTFFFSIPKIQNI